MEDMPGTPSTFHPGRPHAGRPRPHVRPTGAQGGHVRLGSWPWSISCALMTAVAVDPAAENPALSQPGPGCIAKSPGQNWTAQKAPPEGLGFSVREDRGTTLSSFKRHGDSFPPTKPTSLAWRQGSSQDGALPASAVCPSPHVCVTHQACALSPAAPLPVTVLCLPHSFPLTPCQGAQNPTSERFSPRTTFLSGHLLRCRGFQHHLGRATQFPPANQSPPEFQMPPSFPPEHSSWVFCGCGC